MMNLNLLGSFVEHFVLMLSMLAVNDSQFSDSTMYYKLTVSLTIR